MKGITRGALVLGFFDVNHVGLYEKNELLAVLRIGRASSVVQ